MATLAVCKPAIRRRAELGDLVVALNGRDLGEPDKVRWAGVVKEKLGFGQYWHDLRFEGRPDNIYRPDAKGKFEHVGGMFHASEEHHRRDLGGCHVLVFERWWRFGDDGPAAPEGLRMTRGRRNHKVADGVSMEWLGVPHEQAQSESPRRAGRGCAPKHPPGVG